MLIVCISVVQTTVKAQVGIVEGTILTINNDARSVALAGSDIARKGSTNGMLLNPALIGVKNSVLLSGQFNVENGLDLFGTQWPDNLGSRVYTPKLIVGFKNVALGYEFRYFDIGQDLINTNESNPYELSHGISFSHTVNDFFSWGLGVTYFKGDPYSGQTFNQKRFNSDSGFTFDVGLYAQYPLETDNWLINPSAGWLVTDIGGG